MFDIREYLKRSKLFADTDQAVLDQVTGRMQPVVEVLCSDFEIRRT